MENTWQDHIMTITGDHMTDINKTFLALLFLHMHVYVYSMSTVLLIC